MSQENFLHAYPISNAKLKDMRKFQDKDSVNLAQTRQFSYFCRLKSVWNEYAAGSR